MAKVLPRSININQTVFIKNRHLQTNTRPCFILIQYAKKQDLHISIIAVDAEKVFDSLEWLFYSKLWKLCTFQQK